VKPDRESGSGFSISGGVRMFRLSMKSTADMVIAAHRDMGRRQLRFATAVALTRTAQDVKIAEVDTMRRVFDRPTPWTLNSVFVKPATKAELSAVVWLKDVATDGTPATKYLAPEIEGGGRNLKGFERLLMRKGLLPTGWMAVPGAGAKLDAYGNMSRGQIVQIISALQAFGEVGFNANRTKGSRQRRGSRLPEYFVGRPGGGRLPMGVWQRISFAHGSAVRPVLIFVRGPRYKARFDFFGVGRQIARTNFIGHLRRAIAEAKATAR
jgi:hypothetical protein